jgi:beta-galactosidase
LIGVWAEEIDCLDDNERNLVQGLAGNDAGLQGPYQVRHLCELIHAESAKPLATYRDDFYAGRPAVTVNQFGKGKAWHVASRNDLAFQRDFFASLIDELACRVPLSRISRRGCGNSAYRRGKHVCFYSEL